MKFKALITTLVAVVLAFSGSQVLAGKGGNANEKADKVAVKHFPPNSNASKDGQDYIIIEVSGAALAAHIGHGDEPCIVDGLDTCVELPPVELPPE